MRKFLFGLLFFVLLAGGIGYWLVFKATYSEGFRVGSIIKFSHKGWAVKTWEGTLDLGVIVPGDQGGITPRLWDFTVADDAKAVRTAIDQATEKSLRVKLHYHERLFKLSLLGDTQYFVHQVELLPVANPSTPPTPPTLPASPQVSPQLLPTPVPPTVR